MRRCGQFARSAGSESREGEDLGGAQEGRLGIGVGGADASGDHDMGLVKLG